LIAIKRLYFYIKFRSIFSSEGEQRLLWLTAGLWPVTRWRVRFRVSVFKLYEEQSGTVRGLAPSTRVFRCKYQSTNAP